MHNSRNAIYITLYLALVLLLWAGFTLLPGPARVELAEPRGNTYDLTGHDLANTVYTTTAVWESWPSALYTPAELAGAGPPVPHQSLDYRGGVQYATHRLYLQLPPGQTYGISLASSDYAMRLYIDGALAGSVGTPGTTREETTPRTRQVSYYFTPQGETTEIVVQAANFVHKEGGWAPWLTLGTAENISRLDTARGQKNGLLLGCLATAFLFHLAVYMLNRRQRASLVFALLCLLLAVARPRVWANAFPAYNWQVMIRLEYIAGILAFGLGILLLHRLFPGRLHSWGLRAVGLLCALAVGVVLFTGSTLFTRAQLWFYVPAGVAGIGVLVRLAPALHKNPKGVLAFVGVAAVAMFAANSILFKTIYPPGAFFRGLGETFSATAGMVFFVFCYAVVLALDRAEVSRQLEQAHTALTQAEDNYKELRAQVADGQPPRQTLEGLGLTNRETEIALLLLDGKSREEIAGLLHVSIATVHFHCRNLYKKAKVGSLVEFMRLMGPKVGQPPRNTKNPGEF